MKKIVTGMVAHVDAGKTTLSESMLYLSGELRVQGRVDHQDAFLDYDMQERKRGITIFSKVSSFQYGKTQMTFLDTPGHVDLSGEMERTLSILDVAILIINGHDGVQSHTKTIWSLLQHYEIPVMIFINKMDSTPYDRQTLMASLHKELSDTCLDMQTCSQEDLAMCNEHLLEEYLETETLSSASLSQSFMTRSFFPCYFGSALKNEGVDVLLKALDEFAQPVDKEESGIVYKISHDEKGERLTHVRLYHGNLQVKDKMGEEKIHQIRQYQGMRYTLIEKAGAGDVVALTGLKATQEGQMIGSSKRLSHLLSPSMRYGVHLPDEGAHEEMMHYLEELSEDDPLLDIQIKNEHDIHISFMGEVQREVLIQLFEDRFHEELIIDEGEVSYLETIRSPIEGVGHYEPLKHYAEVHLLLEPLERGQGLLFENRCKNELEEHYQRLIMTHLQECIHLGVLTGSPITDMRISLLGGKAHQKHTEGGDFRQATYRALRQGLKRADSLLLEPYDHYDLVVGVDVMSRVYHDLESRKAEVSIEENDGVHVHFSGEGPLKALYPYMKEIITLTRGEGTMTLMPAGFKEVADPSAIISAIGYQSEQDLAHPTGSIFCSHGAGYYVPFDEVEKHMHLPYFSLERSSTYHHETMNVDEEELEAIFERTYGPIKRHLAHDYGVQKKEAVVAASVEIKKECLLVDGYNVIFAWDELCALANINLGAARDRLIDILCSYQGYRDCVLILVFDAYKVKENRGTTQDYHNISIVYTREAQTADMYIESVTKTLAQDYRVVVATSDALEQTIVIGEGATRISSRELLEDIIHTAQTQKQSYEARQPNDPAFLLEGLEKHFHDEDL